MRAIIEPLESREYFSAIEIISRSDPAFQTNNLRSLGAATVVDVSRDGRYVLYNASGSDYLAGINDTNGESDLVLADRQTGSRTLLSRSSTDPSKAAGYNSNIVPDISDNGRYVVFLANAETVATLARPAGTTSAGALRNGLVRYDVQTGELKLLFAQNDSDPSAVGQLQPDGRALACDDGSIILEAAPITSSNSYFGSIDVGPERVVRYDGQTGQISLISHEATDPSVPPSGPRLTVAPSAPPTLPLSAAATNLVPRQSQLLGASSDGRKVVYLTSGINATSQPLSATSSHLIAYDVNSGVATYLGVDYQNYGPAEGDSVAVSNDGSHAVFTSNSSAIISGLADGNQTRDIFVVDLNSGVTQLVSHVSGSPNVAGNGTSSLPVISDDGHFVAFVSTATNLVAGQTTNYSATFRYDSVTGQTALVSHTVDSLTTPAVLTGERAPQISGDGRFVAFAKDVDGLYVFDASTGTNSLVTHRFDSDQTAVQGAFTISGSFPSAYRFAAGGRTIVFDANSHDFVANDTGGFAGAEVFATTVTDGAPAGTAMIDVLGADNQPIPAGEATLSAVVGTDFGSVNIGQAATRTFSISDEGTASLVLSSVTGSIVTVEGPNAADFSVVADPAGTVDAHGQTTFTISFEPTTAGAKAAVIRVQNDIRDYTFSVGGIAVDPAVHSLAKVKVGIAINGKTTSVLGGQKLQVTVTLTNISHQQITGGAVIPLYLSTLPTASGNKAVVSAGVSLRLGAGQSQKLTLTLPIPVSLASGLYFAVAEVRPSSAPTTILGTTAAPALLKITRPAIDLAGAIGKLPGKATKAGKPLTIPITIRNNGNSPFARRTDVRVIFSRDNVLDPNDIVVADITSSLNIAAKKSKSLKLGVATPRAFAGSAATIFVLLDPIRATGDIDPTNNILVGKVTFAAH